MNHEQHQNHLHIRNTLKQVMDRYPTLLSVEELKVLGEMTITHDEIAKTIKEEIQSNQE